MDTAVIAVCGLVGMVIVGLFASDLIRRRHDLMSWRNLFLLGFLHFVCLSGYYCVTQFVALRVSAINAETMALYAAGVAVFFAVFMGCARYAMRRRWPARLIPDVRMPPTTPGILISIAALLALAIPMAAVPSGGYLGLLAVQFRSGMAATAVGLAVYFLLAQRFNPLSWALLGFTFAMGVLVSVVGSIGRRDVLGVLIAVPWMWYWAYLRYRGAGHVAVRLGGAVAAGVLALVVYSGIRGEGTAMMRQGADINQRASQLQELIRNPTITKEAVEYMLYTDTAGNTMYVFANYPAVHPYMPLHGFWWIITNPIPRDLYPDKPVALGALLRDQMQVDPNLGPGIIGQGWTEGGWIGVLAYAAFFGLLYGAMDRALADRAANPYFVALAAAGAGNVLAMPRGDAALFLIQIMAAMISSGCVLFAVRLVAGPMASAFPRLSVRIPGLARPEEAADDDREWPDYGPEPENAAPAQGSHA